MEDIRRDGIRTLSESFDEQSDIGSELLSGSKRKRVEESDDQDGLKSDANISQPKRVALSYEQQYDMTSLPNGSTNVDLTHEDVPTSGFDSNDAGITGFIPSHAAISTSYPNLVHLQTPGDPEIHDINPSSTLENFMTVEAKPKLCDEQQDLVDDVLNGSNVFYTGGAGCGKSFVLRHIVKELRGRGKRVDIVAPTGIAAVNVKGVTLHQYAGWNEKVHEKTLEEVGNMAHRGNVWKRLKRTDVLIIDEISMVSNHMFERLNVMLQEAKGESRRSDEPFGGLQLVVCGDFTQLPPVKPFDTCLECGQPLVETDMGHYRCEADGRTWRKQDKWAFRSDAWKSCKFKCRQLKQIHRQSDEKFVHMLNKCRFYNKFRDPFSREEKNLLLNHSSELEGAIQLCARRADVQNINEKAYRSLNSKEYKYPCVDDWRWNQDQHPELKDYGRRRADGSLDMNKDHRFETELKLKLNTHVLLIHNLDVSRGLVNGSQGVVVGFDTYNLSFKDVLSWYLEPGEDPKNMNRKKLGEHEGVAEQNLQEFIRRVPEKVLPLIEFENGVRTTIPPVCRVVELGAQGDVAPSLICRTQIPLMAAWAITIHKSQGMTLKRMIANLDRIWEPGQAYVALSRATSLQGLTVRNANWPWPSLGYEVRQFLDTQFPKATQARQLEATESSHHESPSR